MRKKRTVFPGGMSGVLESPAFSVYFELDRKSQCNDVQFDSHWFSIKSSLVAEKPAPKLNDILPGKRGFYEKKATDTRKPDGIVDVDSNV
jgi:hypothetical protein